MKAPMRRKPAEILGLIAMMVVLTSLIYWQANPVGQAYNPDNLIRVHVVAHSDSGYDQKIKELVRRHIQAEVQLVMADEGLLEGAGNPADVQRAWSAIQGQSDRLQALVDEVLEREGTEYSGRVEMGVFSFPVRQYEGTHVPSGRYRAVRVILGQGQGENWWCMLFPPLCLVDPAMGYDPPDEVEEAASQLVLEENQMEEAPLEVRWAFLELASRFGEWGHPFRLNLAELGRIFGSPGIKPESEPNH